MAAKPSPKSTTTQADFFSATTTFTNLPAKTYAYQRQDPMDAARESLVSGIQRQLDLLGGKGDAKGRRWYDNTRNGIFCTIRLGNRMMLLNGDSQAFKADSIPEATRLYKLALESVKSGSFERLIADHLKSAPARAKRGAKKV